MLLGGEGGGGVGDGQRGAGRTQAARGPRAGAGRGKALPGGRGRTDSRQAERAGWPGGPSDSPCQGRHGRRPPAGRPGLPVTGVCSPSDRWVRCRLRPRLPRLLGFPSARNQRAEAAAVRWAARGAREGRGSKGPPPASSLLFFPSSADSHPEPSCSAPLAGGPPPPPWPLCNRSHRLVGRKQHRKSSEAGLLLLTCGQRLGCQATPPDTEVAAWNERK